MESVDLNRIGIGMSLRSVVLRLLLCHRYDRPTTTAAGSLRIYSVVYL